MSQKLLSGTEDAYGVHLWEELSAIGFKIVMDKMHIHKCKEELESIKLGAKGQQKRNYNWFNRRNLISCTASWQYHE
eukprot:9195762-Ditylum_brightwellii.AAC.1